MKLPKYANSEIKFIIDEYLHSKDDREIACERLIEGVSVEECARRHNYSVRQMQRIVTRIQTEVFINYPLSE